MKWSQKKVPAISTGTAASQKRPNRDAGRDRGACFGAAKWCSGSRDVHHFTIFTKSSYEPRKNRPFQGPAMTGWWLSPALALWKIMEGYVTVGMTFHSQYDGKVIKNLWFQTTNQWLWTMINHHNPFHGFQSPPAERIPRWGGRYSKEVAIPRGLERSIVHSNNGTTWDGFLREE